MKQTTKTQTVKALVKQEVPVFITDDGVEFVDKQQAKKHEELVKKFPKLSKFDIEFIDSYDNENYDNFLRALNSDNVILLISHSGGDNQNFEIVTPHLVAVQAVIKALHRRVLGCNYNEYVHGVIYKKESLCFNDGKKDNGTYYTTGSGLNIKAVLPE